jgi:oligopeptide/dipeptide ABC transporter ATP-binding protein
VFARPHHPYTVGLLRSIPRVADVGGPLTPIPGAPPDAARLPPGCPFAPRCAWALEACWEEMPPLAPLEPALAAGVAGAAGPQSGPGVHLLACHNPVAPGEVEAGEPQRPGFRPAPPPPGYGLVSEETA